MNKMFGAEEMSAFARETLWCLFKQGPTWDGDLPSKTGRDWLVTKNYAERGDGWNWLTRGGVLLALEIGMGRTKENPAERSRGMSRQPLDLTYMARIWRVFGVPKLGKVANDD